MNTPSNRRKRPAPSARDQQIYLDYQIGKRQTDLAGDHKLTQCRISQIIRRVAAWRSQADAREEHEPTARQQHQLDRFLEHERLNFIAREALRLFREEQTTITTKSGTRGDNAFDETTKRTAPPNVQFLKVALQATRQLSQLEQKPALPFGEPDAEKRERIMLHELRRRAEAEAAGNVTKSVDAGDTSQRFLDALVGQPNDSTRSAAAMRELSLAILPECDRPILTRRASEDEPADPQPTLNLKPEALNSVPSPTLNLEPETLNSAGNSTTSPPRPRSPEPQPPPQLPIPNPQLKIPIPTTNLPDLHTRRLIHQQKLIALREARRQNLPHDFFFDHADGPPPPPPEYVLDGAP